MQDREKHSRFRQILRWLIIASAFFAVGFIFSMIVIDLNYSGPDPPLDKWVLSLYAFFLPAFLLNALAAILTLVRFNSLPLKYRLFGCGPMTVLFIGLLAILIAGQFG